MPRGVTDDNLIEYKQNYRCQASRGRPIDEDSCEQALENLRNVATELNSMVKTGCDYYFGEFLSKAENQACLTARFKEKNGTGTAEATQQACTAEAEKAAQEVVRRLQEFKAKLREFADVMQNIKKLGASISTEIVKSLDETTASKDTPVYNQPNHPTAAKFGLSTMAEANGFNKNQDPKVAAALLREFQERFEKADYSGVSVTNYKQTFEPIEKAWQSLNSQVKSPILKEQLHNYLNAEEIRLANNLFLNQLKEADLKMSQIAKTNGENVNKLHSAGQTPSGVPGGQQNYSSVAGAAMPPLGQLPNFGRRTPGSVSIGESPQATDPLLADHRGRTPFANSVAAGKPAAAQEEESVMSGTAASRMADPSKKLRESLRKRLAEKLGKTGTTEASEAAAATDGSNPRTGEAMEALKELGGEGEAGRLLKGAFGSLEEQARTGFGGELEGERIGIGGSTTDATIKAMIQEFENSVQASPHNGLDIGGTDGPSLFARVKEFHGRCLKKGCVTGLAREETQ